MRCGHWVFSYLVCPRAGGHEGRHTKWKSKSTCGRLPRRALFAEFLFVRRLVERRTNTLSQIIIMKLDVTDLRYVSSEEFRVLTAVRAHSHLLVYLKIECLVAGRDRF